MSSITTSSSHSRAGAPSSTFAGDIHRLIGEYPDAVNAIAFAVDHELPIVCVKKHLSLDAIGKPNGSPRPLSWHYAAPGAHSRNPFVRVFYPDANRPSALIGTTKFITRRRAGDNVALQSPVMDQFGCPFCHLESSRIRAENDFAAAFTDIFPVAEGHSLIVPKHHVASLFDLPEEEQAALWALVALVRRQLMVELKADGFNVGVNDGQAAGQTVMHAHVHVIPRRYGDTDDPRGGIRWIMPKKARYWGEGQ
jgi:diadenosine tetraphosphate (Ap4A) HIT family hydrolase